MNAALDIGRLSTRIRSDEPELAQVFAGELRQLSARQLPDALEAACARALARAGLPAGALVAVQRLDLALRVGRGVDGSLLAEGWASAFEAALAGLLAGTPAGEELRTEQHGERPAIWFADAWAAERRHLEMHARGEADAWWAPALAAAGSSADCLAPLPILLRWLERDPPRAVATMADMARQSADKAGAPLAALLSPDEALTLARRLVRQLAPSSGATHPAGDTAGDTAAILAQAFDLAAARCAALLSTVLAPLAAGRAAPWLVASLLAERPALTRLPAEQIEQALQAWIAARRAPQQASPGPGLNPTEICPAPARPADRPASPRPTVARQPAAPTEPARQDRTTGDGAEGQAAPGPTVARHEVHAGGLLLLLRPLVKLDLLPDAGELPRRLGDLALLALRRVLAPLAAGQRAVGEERERPLLRVFAPECDWRERISTIPIRDAEAAATLLDALVEAIPADIAFAPGAERCVLGGRAAFPTAPAQRLARLLLRPGVLQLSDWDAEITWPLAGIDLALRRSGWDQDPGWVAWIGRTVRFRFGDAP